MNGNKSNLFSLDLSDEYAFPSLKSVGLKLTVVHCGGHSALSFGGVGQTGRAGCSVSNPDSSSNLPSISLTPSSPLILIFFLDPSQLEFSYFQSGASIFIHVKKSGVHYLWFSLCSVILFPCYWLTSDLFILWKSPSLQIFCSLFPNSRFQ